MPAQLTRVDSSCTMPVRLKTYGTVVPNPFEITELGGPINESFVDRRPGNFSVSAFSALRLTGQRSGHMRLQLLEGDLAS